MSVFCHAPLSSVSTYSHFLTLKAPITTAADDIHNFFSEKTRVDVSSESSDKQSSGVWHHQNGDEKDKSSTIYSGRTCRPEILVGQSFQPNLLPSHFPHEI